MDLAQKLTKQTNERAVNNSTIMKSTLLALLGTSLLFRPLAATADLYGDFFYESDGSAVTITRYFYWSGTEALTIPASFYGLPVTAIGDDAFDGSTNLTSVAIPESVTNIGDYAFAGCTSLTNMTIPGNVTHIGEDVFYGCKSLRGVFFGGNAPNIGWYAFYATTDVTVYYLPGTTGWGAIIADRPAKLWNALMQTSGVGLVGFGFNITGTAEIPIVVEACTNLANASWVPLQSLSLTNGAVYFSDPDWTNYPVRIYRIRSP
jgi:hypothetical protein